MKKIIYNSPGMDFYYLTYCESMLAASLQPGESEGITEESWDLITNLNENN